MGFEIKHLDPVVVYVADIDRAIRFYADVLGCKVERKVESIGTMLSGAGGRYPRALCGRSVL